MMMEMMMVMVYMYTVRAYREYGNLIFPSNPKDLTPSWLSSVLHKNGMLPSSIIIKSFKGEKLDGGYHSKVRKFEVEYSSLPPFSPSPLSSSSSSPSPSLNGIYYNNINILIVIIKRTLRKLIIIITKRRVIIIIAREVIILSIIIIIIIIIIIKKKRR